MITSINDFRKTFESIDNDAITYSVSEISDSDDMLYISANMNNEQIGTCGVELASISYENDFSELITEDEYNTYFPHDKMFNICELKVDSKHRGTGIAKKLISIAIEKAKELDFLQLYLNADAIDYYQGLNQADLIKFYQSCGFQIMLDQTTNCLMYMNLESTNEGKTPTDPNLSTDIVGVKKDTLEPLNMDEWEIDKVVDIITDVKEIAKYENAGSNVSLDLTVKEVKVGQKIYLTALLKPKNKSTAYPIGEMGVICARVTDVFYGLNKLNQLSKSGKLLR